LGITTGPVVPLLEVELVLVDVELVLDVELEVDPVLLDVELVDVEPVLVDVELLALVDVELVDVEPVPVDVELLVLLLEVVAPPPFPGAPVGPPQPVPVARSIEASTNSVGAVFMVGGPP
jgi:hypothetical protein